MLPLNQSHPRRRVHHRLRHSSKTLRRVYQLNETLWQHSRRQLKQRRQGLQPRQHRRHVWRHQRYHQRRRFRRRLLLYQQVLLGTENQMNVKKCTGIQNLFGHVTKSFVTHKIWSRTNQVHVQINFLTLLFISCILFYIFYYITQAKVYDIPLI